MRGKWLMNTIYSNEKQQYEFLNNLLASRRARKLIRSLRKIELKA